MQKIKSYPCNRPWRPMGPWDVEAPTFCRQSAHRWRWGCQPYAPAALYSRKIPGTHFSYRLSRPQGHSAAGRIRSIEKSGDLIGNRTRCLRLVAECLNQLRYRVLPQKIRGTQSCCHSRLNCRFARAVMSVRCNEAFLLAYRKTGRISRQENKSSRYAVFRETTRRQGKCM
jgi:hypothetical protein